MRKFEKSYLDKWNDRLKRVNLYLSFSGITFHNFDVVTIFRTNDNMYSGPQGVRQPIPIYEIPEIPYLFNFSVSKKCSKRFYKLLQEILKSGTQFYYRESSSSKSDVPFICKKNLSDFTIEKSDVKIHEAEYIQNTCKFNANLFEVIHFVNSVESAVEIISKYFEYEEDGTEICKTKFKVNEIVSTKEDRSGNYMIMDFEIQQDNTIYYKLSKIENCLKSEVIIFDGISILQEVDIISNREDRLNILLN